jgi:hypothetical protein
VSDSLCHLHLLRLALLLLLQEVWLVVRAVSCLLALPAKDGRRLLLTQHLQLHLLPPLLLLLAEVI